jgi:hypothetical protein
MDENTRNIILATIVAFILLGVLIIVISHSYKCKPHCSGAYCGPNSDDGCGNPCDCREGGKCQNSTSGPDKCCYSNCDGIHCGPDSCGGPDCGCDAIPNGVCNTIFDAKGQAIKRCCYKQDCNNVYCGKDGCGGTCTCLEGSTCSNSGVCSNSGTSGWTYNILSTPGMKRSNQASPEECSGWLPENLNKDLLNFPCSSESDCPPGDKCMPSSNGSKFCNRNNVYQYWIYDPSDPSGSNCTKLLSGSIVCGVPKSGASAFDIIENVGPDQQRCGETCTILPSCPPTGPGACCPQNWLRRGGSSECTDAKGVTKCCLNDGTSQQDYQNCIGTYPSCENIPDNWWKADKAEIQNGVCGVVSTGNLQINPQTLQSPAFSSPCVDKSPSDPCVYNDGTVSYAGICKPCTSDGKLHCLPDKMCVAQYMASNQPGICSSENVC